MRVARLIALQACGNAASVGRAGGGGIGRSRHRGYLSIYLTIYFDEDSALEAQIDTEGGTWAYLWFGPINVGIWSTSLTVEHGKALEAAKKAPLPINHSIQSGVWVLERVPWIMGRSRGARF